MKKKYIYRHPRISSLDSNVHQLLNFYAQMLRKYHFGYGDIIEEFWNDMSVARLGIEEVLHDPALDGFAEAEYFRRQVDIMDSQLRATGIHCPAANIRGRWWTEWLPSRGGKEFAIDVKTYYGIELQEVIRDPWFAPGGEGNRTAEPEEIEEVLAGIRELGRNPALGAELLQRIDEVCQLLRQELMIQPQSLNPALQDRSLDTLLRGLERRSVEISETEPMLADELLRLCLSHPGIGAFSHRETEYAIALRSIWWPEIWPPEAGNSLDHP